MIHGRAPIATGFGVTRLPGETESGNRHIRSMRAKVRDGERDSLAIPVGPYSEGPVVLHDDRALYPDNPESALKPCDAIAKSH